MRRGGGGVMVDVGSVFRFAHDVVDDAELQGVGGGEAEGLRRLRQRGRGRGRGRRRRLRGEAMLKMACSEMRTRSAMLRERAAALPPSPVMTATMGVSRVVMAARCWAMAWPMPPSSAARVGERAAGVDEGNDGEGEFFGEVDGAGGFADALGLDVGGEAVAVVRALVADNHDGFAAEVREAGEETGVVAAGAVAVQFDEGGGDAADVVEGGGAVGVARHGDFVPGADVAVRAADEGFEAAGDFEAVGGGGEVDEGDEEVALAGAADDLVNEAGFEVGFGAVRVGGEGGAFDAFDVAEGGVAHEGTGLADDDVGEVGEGGEGAAGGGVGEDGEVGEAAGAVAFGGGGGFGHLGEGEEAFADAHAA